MSEYELTLIFNRLQVIRAAAEHGQLDTVIHAVNLIELQIVRCKSSPTVRHLVPFRKSA